jgi:hypothetical protein
VGDELTTPQIKKMEKKETVVMHRESDTTIVR